MKKTLKNIAIAIILIIVIIAWAWIYKFNYLASLDWYDVDWNKIQTEVLENNQN
jgi:uncharacterized protein YybS (DUF2232 family)